MFYVQWHCEEMYYTVPCTLVKFVTQLVCGSSLRSCERQSDFPVKMSAISDADLEVAGLRIRKRLNTSMTDRTYLFPQQCRACAPCSLDQPVPLSYTKCLDWFQRGLIAECGF